VGKRHRGIERQRIDRGRTSSGRKEKTKRGGERERRGRGKERRREGERYSADLFDFELEGLIGVFKRREEWLTKSAREILKKK
jgi:hypothetical protein